MEISFDPAKREATLRERGLDFGGAEALFAEPTVEDGRFAYGETCFLTFGLRRGRLTTIAWTSDGEQRSGDLDEETQ